MCLFSYKTLHPIIFLSDVIIKPAQNLTTNLVNLLEIKNGRKRTPKI